MKKIFLIILWLFQFINSHAQTDSSQFYYQKGLTALNAKLYLVASVSFDKAIKFNPKYEDAYLQDARANLEMHRTDNAQSLLLKAYEINPANKETISQLMNLDYDYHQYAKAVELAKKCESCAGSSRIIALGEFENEDYGAAVDGLTKVLAANPGDAVASYTMAQCYLEMEQDEKAVPFYLQAIQSDSTQTVWMYELGILYYNLYKYPDAVKYMNMAVSRGYFGGNDLNENLGFANLYAGNFEDGESLLAKVMARKPKDKELIRDVAEAFYKAKQYDKSLSYCQKLLEMDMSDAKALYQAGLCFIKKGNEDKGQQMCDKAIQMDPSLAGLRQVRANSSDMGL